MVDGCCFILFALLSMLGCDDATQSLETDDSFVPSTKTDTADTAGTDSIDTTEDETVSTESEIDTVPLCGTLDWVSMPGGAFMMGSPEGMGEARERPEHEVHIEPFEILRTEVTTVEYECCVDNGGCRPTPADQWCTHSDSAPEHPVTCVDWFMAKAYCQWVGGRLPSEAEWEYAATSGGKDILYPWGDAPATCERAVTDGESGEDRGCGMNATWPVCSKPLGNSDQGLCDLAGNVYEWVEDWLHVSYEIDFNGQHYVAPDDGSPWLEPVTNDFKIMRGGGISSDDDFRSAFRQYHPPDFFYGGLGIRCVR